MTDQAPLGLLVIVIVVLLVLSAFFSATETALMSLNRYRLRHQARSGHRGARVAEWLLQRPNRLIGLIMLMAVGGCIWQLVRRQVSPVRGIAILALVSAPVLLATIRVFPDAKRAWLKR